MTYQFFDVHIVVVIQGKIVQGAHPIYIESTNWLAGSYLLNLLFADGRSETMGVVVQH